jgi:hypothetical protein
VAEVADSNRFDIPGEQAPEVACRDWYAIHNHQTPGPPVLRVTGNCRFDTAGWSVVLRRHEAQGINPVDLLLDRVVLGPNDQAADRGTEVEVRYDEETEFEYETVTILPDGPSIPVREIQ